jgi:probable F420-dependent oxidoreductase
VFDAAGLLLRATSEVTVATGILNIWMHDPEEAAAERAQLDDAYEGRFLLGLGVSHAPMVNQVDPGRYRHPLQNMARYLDELTAVPRQRRVIAALGPKMLDLAQQQSIGTHPYLVTPQMTARTRGRVQPGFLVAVEQGVVLETDPARARAVAREHLSGYLKLPNYVNNWLRSGYEPKDVTDGGSDRLVDGLIAWGDASAVADRIRAHYAAGADHVCVQVLGGAAPVPVPEWRAIAKEVLAA